MIGVGVITCNRPVFLRNLLSSLVQCESIIDELVVVNDGNPINDFDLHQGSWIDNPKNLGVGESKNIAMKHLLDKGCDYIFTLEDDILIKDKTVFNKYIDISKETGIQHMNFGFSQKENLDHYNRPVYRKIIEYKNSKIVLTPNILGAFTFYTRTALQTVGLHHHKFNKGHGDHPELTYRAYKHGFTTPFWWFADIYGSWDMIENQSNMGSDSLVRNQEKFMANFKEACETFKELHGVNMLEVPDKSEEEVVRILKNLKNASSL